MLQPACLIFTTWKRKQPMEKQPRRTCEQTKNESTTKSRHIHDQAFYCSILPTNNVTVSLKDGFTFWRHSQKEDSCE